MNFLTTRHIFRKSTVLPFLCALALAGCEDGFNTTTNQTPTSEGTAVETIEVDVVAPEAFSITDTALWDGRPTFGGVWVAYPDIETPERVRIRNDDNGKEIIAALYRRERDFPGPKIELSADAAAALGVLAGSPTELTIVALRRKTVEVEVEEPAPLGDPDMTTPVRRATPEVEAEPAEPEEKVEAPAPVAPPAPVETSEIEETELPPVSAEPAPEDVAIKKFIQVATLQNKTKADVVVAKLITAGLDAEIREREAGGKTLYRIVVGPATSVEALEIMMSVVVELGFKDSIILG